MSTRTPNLNLYKPDATDPFEDFRSEFNDNMDILDGSGGGGGIPPWIFSDNERRVGVWRDNKPLYQKTVDFGAMPALSGSKTVAHGISDIENLANAIFTVKRSGTIQFRILPNVARSSTQAQTLWYMNTTEIGVISGSSADITPDFSGFVTVWYTKTTDTAGSGDWNTNGIPTAHYSLNEQVIGTWIDGKPLYQKTIDCGNLPNTGTKSVNHGISDLKQVLSCECMFDASTWGGNIPFLSMTGSTLSQAGCIAISYTTTALNISAGSNRSGCTAYATLRYTKTTD